MVFPNLHTDSFGHVDFVHCIFKFIVVFLHYLCLHHYEKGKSNYHNWHFSFFDNTVLSATYLQDNYLDSYNALTTGQITEYLIDFKWPDGNIVTAKKEDIFDNTVTLTSSEFERSDYYPVRIQSEDGVLTIATGYLLIIDDTYYYTDFSESTLENDYYFDPSEYSELLAHEITDATLCANLLAAENAYYDDDFGFLYDDDLSETILSVFVIILLILVPLMLFILFLILAIRSKTIYKKFFRTIYILSAAELVMIILFLFLSR